MIQQEIITILTHNKFIRTLIYPLNTVYRWVMLRNYKKSVDSEFLKTLRDIHKGQRCFIIGNGPSLKTEDLERIQNELSFGTNKIYYIFDRTVWRPSYYVCTDTNCLAVEIDHIKASGDYLKFINFKAERYGRDIKDKICYICTKGKYHINAFSPQASELSTDVSDHVAWVHTVTVTAIEIAIYMGFKEIYLLGVDNNWSKTVGRDGRVYRNRAVKADYFSGMKGTGSTVGDKSIIVNINAMNYSYELAKKMAEEKGVKIFNATRGGNLEVFDRVDFDGLMNNQ